MNNTKNSQVCRRKITASQLQIFHHLVVVFIHLAKAMWLLTFDGTVCDGVHEDPDERVLLAPGQSNVCLRLMWVIRYASSQ